MEPHLAIARAGRAVWPLMAAARASTPVTSIWARPTTTAGPHTLTNHKRKKHHMPNTKSSNSPNSDTANSHSDMRHKIINYIRAGYAGLFLVSPEEQRVQAELKGIAREVGFNLYVWSTTSGLIDTDKGAAHPAHEPLEAPRAIT